MGKKRRSQREFMLHKMFHTWSPNSGVSYQMVSYREKTIIYGRIFMSFRVTSEEEVLPLGPHLHFHLFHLVGLADPKKHREEYCK